MLKSEYKATISVFNHKNYFNRKNSPQGTPSLWQGEILPP
jgi:hypothetical protein